MPVGGIVVSIILSHVWKFKWLIAAATIAAASVTFVVSRSETPEIWTGKTTLTIGMAPTKSYLLQEVGSTLAPIETQSEVIAHISDPLFKNKIIGQTAFRPATALFSRGIAASSLRAVALNSERDVAVEISAGSEEDVQAVLRSLGTEIEKEHREILKRRLEFVSAEVEDLQSRVAVVEKSIEASNCAPSSVTDDKNQPRQPVSLPDTSASTRTWNDLKDRVRRSSNLIKLSELTVFRSESDSYPRAARSVGALRASIFAGLSMLAVMIILTIVVSFRPRTSG
jgi:hypothetical protein